MRFADPAFLWLLVGLVPLALLRGRRAPIAAVLFPSAEIARTAARSVRPAGAGGARLWIRFAALACLAVALARPQLAESTADVEASGIDIVLAIDVSGSMQALDFKLGDKPASRLDVVKSVVGEFIDGRPNDRLSLIAFAGQPYMVSPLTLDHDWLVQALQRVRLGLVEDGTAIGSGIAAAVNRLRDQASKSKVVILLTDGVNNAGKIAPLTAADAARALGVKVYTIGAGTRGQAPMPVTDRLGRQTIVMAQVDVDEDTLRKIAEATGGQFFRATDSESLKQIYSEIDRLEKTTAKLKRYEQVRELFPWAIGAGLLILGLELALAEGRLRRLP